MEHFLNVTAKRFANSKNNLSRYFVDSRILLKISPLHLKASFLLSFSDKPAVNNFANAGTADRERKGTRKRVKCRLLECMYCATPRHTQKSLLLRTFSFIRVCDPKLRRSDSKKRDHRSAH